MGEKIGSYKDLHVFQNAMGVAMEVFDITKQFPIEEKYSMVDQMRRSSRSVCANIAEAWSPTRKLVWKEGSVFFRLSTIQREVRSLLHWSDIKPGKTTHSAQCGICEVNKKWLSVDGSWL